MIKMTQRQIEISLSKSRREFLTNLMNVYCKEHDTTEWKIKFIDVKKVYNFDAEAFVHTSKKTMFIKTEHLGKNVPAGFFFGIFLHEFAHILQFEAIGFNPKCTGLYGYQSFFSKHGRNFRKMAYYLGVDERYIPTYTNTYQ